MKAMSLKARRRWGKHRAREMQKAKRVLKWAKGHHFARGWFSTLVEINPDLYSRRRRDVQERMGYFTPREPLLFDDFISMMSFGSLVRRAYERSVGASAKAAIGAL